MKNLQQMSNQELYTYAKTRIPGGIQLLSKRPEQFAPNQWPNYATRAEGCQDPTTRQMDVPVPAYGLSSVDFYRKYMYVTVSDHSFRREPALKILKRCFGME